MSKVKSLRIQTRRCLCEGENSGDNGKAASKQAARSAKQPSSKPWLPHAIRLQRLTSGAVRASGLDTQPEEDPEVAETVIYDLTAVICHVNDERKNVVALINVAPSYFERAGQKPRSSWYIFNDFRYVFVYSV